MGFIGNRFCEQLSEVTSEILINEPMSGHTTIKAGGAARYYVSPRSAIEAADIIKLCGEWGVRLFPLGNGSNVLFRDGGFDGVVLSLLNVNDIELTSDNGVKAGAGVHLKDLSAFCAANGLTGLEFSCGIPGSVGGAAYMNAGAYERDIGGRISKVELIGKDGSLVTKTREEMRFGYRKSAAGEEGLVVVSAEFSLESCGKERIYALIDEYNEKRAAKQPLEAASAGSAFKRPEGHFAGKLIMDSGLKGFSIGGAQVSEKHCGFIINKGGAAAADITALIGRVTETVFDKFGVMLEPEIIIAGDNEGDEKYGA